MRTYAHTGRPFIQLTHWFSLQLHSPSVICIRAWKAFTSARNKKSVRKRRNMIPLWSSKLFDFCLQPPPHSPGSCSHACWAKIDLLQAFSIPVPPLLACICFMSIKVDPYPRWPTPTPTPFFFALVISVPSLIRLCWHKKKKRKGKPVRGWVIVHILTREHWHMEEEARWGEVWFPLKWWCRLYRPELLYRPEFENNRKKKQEHSS